MLDRIRHALLGNAQDRVLNGGRQVARLALDRDAHVVRVGGSTPRGVAQCGGEICVYQRDRPHLPHRLTRITRRGFRELGDAANRIDKLVGRGLQSREHCTQLHRDPAHSLKQRVVDLPREPRPLLEDCRKAHFESPFSSASLFLFQTRRRSLALGYELRRALLYALFKLCVETLDFMQGAPVLRSLHRFPSSIAPGEHEVMRFRQREHVHRQRLADRIGAEDEQLPPLHELVQPHLILLHLLLILLLRPTEITSCAQPGELGMLFEVSVQLAPPSNYIIHHELSRFPEKLLRRTNLELALGGSFVQIGNQFSQSIKHLHLCVGIWRNPDTQLPGHEPRSEEGNNDFDQIDRLLVKEREVRRAGNFTDRVNAGLAGGRSGLLHHCCTIYHSRGSQRVRARGTAYHQEVLYVAPIMRKELSPGNEGTGLIPEGSFSAGQPGYGAVFEQCPTPLVVYDRSFRVVDCNEATAQVFGTTRERIIGMRIEDMRDQRHRTALEAALAGETVTWESPYQATITDGWFWGSATFAPLRDVAGEIVGVIVALTSGTSRVEQSTRSLEIRLGESQRLGRVGSWIYDVRRRRVEGSPELFRIIGVNSAMLAWPHDLLKYIHLEDRDSVLARIDSVISAEKPFALCEFRIVRPGGSTRHVVIRGEFKYAPDGTPLMAWGTLQDITERHALEEQLQRARQMEGLGQLAGGVAHDFNNILTVIQVETGFLLEALSDNDPLTAEVTEIRRAAERAAGLTRQLLAFSRKQILRPRLVHLNTLVTDTTNMLRRLIGEDIELVTQLTSDEAATLSDPGQLEQVLVNLAVNARDAMPKGGVLRIETSVVTVPSDDIVCAAGDYAVLTVSDTGHGMDENVRRRIFDPFFTTKPPGKGTGLGLSTVFGIVEQSEGKVFVDSAPGRGARFTIYLPRATPGSAPSNPQPARVADRSDPIRATLLLVEDEPVLRSVSQRALESEGYTVLTAEDGFDAVAVAETFSGTIDLMITDVVLPGLNGRALAERLRERRPNLEVLYMTGYTDDEILRRGLMADQVNLLDKPFNAAQLLDAARRAIRPG